MPPGWAETTLGDACEVVMGQSPPGTSYNGDAVGMPFLQGKAEFGDLRPTVRKWTTAPKKLARKGDVLLSVRAPVGPTNLAPVDCAIGRGLVALHPLGGIDPRFILYAMRGSVDRLAEQATGTTFSAVSRSTVGDHPILLPPLPEQRRIVAAIEEQFSRIDAAEESLRLASRKLTRLRSACLEATYADRWPLKEIGLIADVFVGSTPRRDQPELWGGDIPWVSSGEVAFCRINRTAEQISARAIGDTAKRLHPPGTVLLAMIGEGKTRGQAAVLDVHATHNQNSAAIRLHPRTLTPGFLFYALMARYEATRRLGSGNNQPALNKSRVMAIEVPVPPFEDQPRIVAEVEQHLSNLDVIESAMELALKRSAILKRAVLDRAFRGILVRQDPTDEPAPKLLERIAAGRNVRPTRAGQRARTPASAKQHQGELKST